MKICYLPHEVIFSDMPHLRSGPRFAGLTIGLLGGSFNPAHQGHLAMSLYALKRLGLNQVWWLVSPQNPLKTTKDMASLEKRMAKAKDVVTNNKIVVTDIEAQFGTRYTVDTLRALREHFPRVQFVWLMGADNLKQMPKWREWPEIFRLVPVAVFRRPAYGVGRGLGKVAQRFRKDWLPAKNSKLLARHSAPAWLVLDNKLNPMSATDIRHKR